MPITKKDLYERSLSFCGKNDVWVIIGPCAVTSWLEPRIALDGRKYKTGGTVTFKNGQSYRASFYVDTTTFDFVSKESIYVSIGEDWYQIDEPALLTEINITKEDIYPIKWQTDRPLDYYVRPPYTLAL